MADFTDAKAAPPTQPTPCSSSRQLGQSGATGNRFWTIDKYGPVKRRKTPSAAIRRSFSTARCGRCLQSAVHDDMSKIGRLDARANQRHGLAGQDIVFGLREHRVCNLRHVVVLHSGLKQRPHRAVENSGEMRCGRASSAFETGVTCRLSKPIAGRARVWPKLDVRMNRALVASAVLPLRQ